MDVQMPELDGLETTRRIRRELPPESQPYIIAVTAAAFPEDRMRCLEAGMNDYLAKPVDLAELTNALRRARPPIALPTFQRRPRCSPEARFSARPPASLEVA